MIYTVTFNPAIDYVVRLDAPLEVGQVNRACGEDCVLGGKGINVSGVLAQLGCPSVALGFVAGETGAWLERGLAAQGLHTDFVHLENGMTRINVKIKAGQETELNGAGPDIPDEALHQLEEKLDGLTENDVLSLAGSIPASLPQDVYERLLARQPDVLDAHQIARVTGYASRTVSRWCIEGRLKSFPYHHTYKVPKEWLLEFLTSKDYNSITRKSKEHYAMIAAVASKPRKPRKKP